MQLNENFVQAWSTADAQETVLLVTPSGRQRVASRLVADLARQLAFSPFVYDLITRPVVDPVMSKTGSDAQAFVPDLLVLLSPANEDHPFFLLLDAVENDLQGRPIDGGAACWHAAVAYRAVLKSAIHTPYLGNAIHLAPFKGPTPDHEALCRIRELLDKGPASFADLTSALQASGLSPEGADAVLYAAIANRDVRCDLSLPLNDGSIITHAEPSWRGSIFSSPILSLILRPSA